MNKLLKYILIVNIVFIILGVLLVSLNELNENYRRTHVPPLTFDSEGNPLPRMAPPNPYSYIVTPLGFLTFYLFPVFVILMAGLYMFKNPNRKGYFKSLLIPLSYLIIGGILAFILGYYFLSGEEGMGVLFLWFQMIITIVAVAIVNLIIFLIKRQKSVK